MPLYQSFAEFARDLIEAPEDESLALKQVSMKNAEQDEDIPRPDETLVSAEELPDTVERQRGSLDAREAERVPSDTPDNQSKLVIHPTGNIKQTLATRLQQHRADAKAEAGLTAEEFVRRD